MVLVSGSVVWGSMALWFWGVWFLDVVVLVGLRVVLWLLAGLVVLLVSGYLMCCGSGLSWCCIVAIGWSGAWFWRVVVLAGLVAMWSCGSVACWLLDAGFWMLAALGWLLRRLDWFCGIGLLLC